MSWSERWTWPGFGQFDVVFFFGVLYPLTDPLGAQRRGAHVTARGGLAVVESDAMVGMEDRAACEFFPSEEPNHGASNWWAPNVPALEGLSRAAGFWDVASLTEGQSPPPIRYRLIAHIGRALTSPVRMVRRLH